MEKYQNELEDIKKLLLENPNGLTILEISDKIKVNRNSVAKYMDVLQTNGSVEKKQAGSSKIFYLSKRIPLSAIFDLTSDSFLTFDKDLKVININKNFENLPLFSKKIAIGSKLNEEPLNTLYLEVELDIKRAFYGKIVKRELSIKKKDKNYSFHMEIIPTTFQNGKPGLTLILEDLSNIKKAQEEAIQSKQDFKNIVETANEGIAISKTDGIFIFVNEKWADMLGYSKEEILGKTDLDFVEDQEKERILKTREGLAEGKKLTREFQFIKKDGSILSTLSSVTPIYNSNGNHISNLAMHVDITDKKNALEMLKIKEEELKRAQRIAKLGMWTLDIRTGKVTWPPESEHLLGRDPNDYLSTYEGFFKLVHPDDRETVKQTYEESVKEHKEFDIVHRMLKQDGQLLHVREVGYTIYDEEGKPLISKGIIQDITKIKEAEDETEKSCNPILRVNSEGTIIYANSEGQNALRDYDVQKNKKAPKFITDIVPEVLKTGKIREIAVKIGKEKFFFSIIPLDTGYVNIYGFNLTRLMKEADNCLK